MKRRNQKKISYKYEYKKIKKKDRREKYKTE